MRDDQLDMLGSDDSVDVSKALEAIGDPRRFRWEGTLRDMLDTVRAALKQYGLGETEIERAAPLVVVQLCMVLGGQIIYLPRGVSVRRAMRDASIFDQWRFHRMQAHELAREFRLSVQAIYKIIAKQRALTRRNEPDLFGFKETT